MNGKIDKIRKKKFFTEIIICSYRGNLNNGHLTNGHLNNGHMNNGVMFEQKKFVNKEIYHRFVPYQSLVT